MSQESKESTVARIIPLLELLLKGQENITQKLEGIGNHFDYHLQTIDEKIDNISALQEDLQRDLDTVCRTGERTNNIVRNISHNLDHSSYMGGGRTTSISCLRGYSSYNCIGYVSSNDTDSTLCDDRSSIHSSNKMSYRQKREKKSRKKYPNMSKSDPQQRKQQAFINNLSPSSTSQPQNIPKIPVLQSEVVQPGNKNANKDKNETTSDIEMTNTTPSERKPVPSAKIQNNFVNDTSNIKTTGSVVKSSSPSSHIKQSNASSNDTLPSTPNIKMSSNILKNASHSKSNVPFTEEGATSSPMISIDWENHASFLRSVEIVVNDANMEMAIQNIFTAEGRQEQSCNSIPGLRTVLLLDTSFSINDKIFRTMNQFYQSFIEEVETSASDHRLEETIAVAQFGGKCQMVHGFTNDYTLLKECFEKVVTGGKTPLLIGLAMVTAYLHKFGKSVTVNGRVIQPRIIVISDGLITNHDNVGTEQDFEANSIMCQCKVMNFLPVLRNLGYTVSCVGVGEFNKEFLTRISQGQCKGRFYDGNSIENSSLLGRYYRYQNAISKILSRLNKSGSEDLVTVVTNVASTESSLKDEDMEEMIKLCKLQLGHRNIDKSHLQKSEPLEKPVPLPAHDEDTWESDNEELKDVDPTPYGRTYPFGTRVARGINWRSEWENDDQGKAGTVVAHSGEGEVIVKWDNKKFGKYPQQYLSKDVGARILEPSESIAVGCRVKRGLNWSRGDEDGGEGTVGITLRKHRNKTVTVLWPFGIMETYDFGRDGNNELLVLNPSLDEAREVNGNPMPIGSGETIIAWQWQDEEGQWRTLSEEESAKLQSQRDQRQSGSVLVTHYGIQLRCSLDKMKYREQGGRDRSGDIKCIVTTAEEMATLRFIENDYFQQ